VLSAALHVDIPRASLRYMLIHHLKLVYTYTKKRQTFKNTVKRQHRIRRFMIEMDRALKLQDAVFGDDGSMEARGDYVMVFTDETYLHTNHSPLTSWVPEDAPFVGKTTSKGNRLIVLHAVTCNGFVAKLNVDGTPIAEPALEGRRESCETAEWIWKANSKHKDYHKNMDGVGFEWWLENRLKPAFRAQFPGKKMILVIGTLSATHTSFFCPSSSDPRAFWSGHGQRLVPPPAEPRVLPRGRHGGGRLQGHQRARAAQGRLRRDPGGA
jgi:hypothetical protein